jgi:hypothetical protein
VTSKNFGKKLKIMAIILIHIFLIGPKIIKGLLAIFFINQNAQVKILVLKVLKLYEILGDLRGLKNHKGLKLLSFHSFSMLNDHIYILK